MKNLIIFSGIVLFLFVAGGILISMYISQKTIELEKYQNIVAQYDNLRNNYDNTWKQIKQVANVSDNYKNAFIEAYKSFIDGRNYGEEQIKLIFEDNPEFNPQLWENIQNVIQKQRNVFTAEQTRFLAMKADYIFFCDKPTSFFVSPRDLSKMNIITSLKTEKVFEEAKDDDISVF